MIRQLRALLASIFFFSLCSLGFAQSAQIQGQVSDSSGAVIPKATVRIVNQLTGTERKVATNGNGQYNVPGLDPSVYKIFVQAPGFSTAMSTPITLNVAQNAVLDFKMQVGSEAQSVTVDGSGAQLNMTDASVGTVIDQRFVENIPLNGRSFQDLISMTPGVVTQSPQTSQAIGASGDFSVNGQRTESNYYTIDGVSANIGSGAPNGGPQAATSGSVGATTALGTTQSLISVDALQEFRVSGSTYSAEYGRSPGGQFSLATRSGTNDFHGSAFDYLRNNFFDSNNWFNDYYGKPTAALRQNDFGGTLGGPIWLPRLYSGKGKSFFFASYEGLRLTLPEAAVVQYVPDANMRQHAPAALQPILNAFPLPSLNGIDYASGLAQFIEPYSVPSQINSTSIRVDQVVSPKLSLFFRFGDTPSRTASRTLSALTTSAFNTTTYTLGATSQFSRRMTNELRLGYSQSGSNSHAVLDSFGGATPVNLGTAFGNGASSSISTFEMSFSGTGNSILTTDLETNKGHQWNLVDTTEVALGKHQIKFGVDYRKITSPLNPSTPLVEPIYITESEVINNSALEAILAQSLPATPVFNETAAFVQDEWRITSRLSLSGGLRWEIDPPPSEEHGNQAFTVFGNLNDPASLTLAPRGTPLWKTSWYNIAPRIGAAWTAHNEAGRETVVRAGGGVFFDTDDEVAANGYDFLGFTGFQIIPGAVLPVTPAQLNFGASLAKPYTTVVAFPAHLQLPYTLQWNVSLQQALGKSQTVTISYVASEGRRLIEILEQSVSNFNPSFTNVDSLQAGITSNYQALQVQFQRSARHGLQALASYTWSHSIDFGSQDSAQPATRGNSDFDVRNNAQVGLTWDLAAVHGGRVITSLFGHWGIDGRLIARSAFPITLHGNRLTDPATGSQYYGNVNVVPNQPLYLYSSIYPGGRELNKAAFQLPTSGTGDAPRNFVRGFGETQLNLAVRRDFPIRDKFSIQFRAETFNSLNHPIFGLVDSTLTDATFGQATQTLNQSLGTMSPQYQQGGPRSMQFALKAQF